MDQPFSIPMLCPPQLLFSQLDQAFLCSSPIPGHFQHQRSVGVHCLVGVGGFDLAPLPLQYVDMMSSATTIVRVLRHQPPPSPIEKGNVGESSEAQHTFPPKSQYALSYFLWRPHFLAPMYVTAAARPEGIHWEHFVLPWFHSLSSHLPLFCCQ